MFSITTFDKDEMREFLNERDIAMQRASEWEACYRKYLRRTTRLDGTIVQRVALSRDAASNELGYSLFKA